MKGVVTVSDGGRSLAVYIDSADSRRLPVEELAVEYVKQLDPAGAWRATKVRDVGTIGPVRVVA